MDQGQALFAAALVLGDESEWGTECSTPEEREKQVLPEGITLDSFEGGGLAVCRLAPTDYHRYHSPIQCSYTIPRGSPGSGSSPSAPTTIPDGASYLGTDLLLVKPMAVNAMDVFTRNKRLVLPLVVERTEPSMLGRLVGRGSKPGAPTVGDCVLYVIIGATHVGTIELDGKADSTKHVKKGAGVGCFKYGGSTIVMLFQRNAIRFDADLVKNSAAGKETLVKMGQTLGTAARP